MIFKKLKYKKLLIGVLAVILLALIILPVFSSTANAEDGDFELDARQNPASADPSFAGAGEVIDKIRWGEKCSWDEVSCHFIFAIRQLILWVLFALGSLFAFLLGLAAQFLDIMIFMAARTPQLPIVSIGFGLTLSFTNVLFVLAIIIMAFATILRFENWSAKALLKRLIIAALLVNFSFFIAGVILDTSNVFAGVFSSAFNPNAIGRAVQPQKLILSFGTQVDNIRYDPTETTEEDTGTATGERQTLEPGDIDKKVIGFDIPLNQGDWGQFFAIVKGLFLSVFLTFILVISLFSLAIMVFIRSLHIAFLLILMPLIWPISVIPMLKKYWDEWWGAFMKWAIYLPTISFFIWLAVKSMDILSNESTAGVYNEIKAQATGPMAQITLMVFDVFLISALILGGLLVSKKFSLAGAAGGLAAAGWVGNKIKGGGKKVGKYALRNPGKTAGLAAGAALGASGLGVVGAVAGGLIGRRVGRDAEGGAKSTGRAAARLGSRATGAAANAEGKKGFFARLATGSLTKGEALEKANKLGALANASKEVKEAQKRLYSNLTNKQFDATPLPDLTEERAAKYLEANKRGRINKIPKDQLQDLESATQRSFNLSEAKDAPPGEGVAGIKEAYHADPELEAEVSGKSIEDVIAGKSLKELLKIEDMSKAVADAMINRLNPKTLSNYHKDASSNNSTELMAHLAAAAAPTLKGSGTLTTSLLKDISTRINSLKSTIAKTTGKGADKKINQLNIKIADLENAKTAITSGKSSSKIPAAEASQKFKYLNDGVSAKDTKGKPTSK